MDNKRFNLWIVGIAIVSLLFAFVVTGFTHQTGGSGDELIGTWKDQVETSDMTLTFSKKGTFSINDVAAGKFSYENGILTLTYNEELGGSTSTYKTEFTDNGSVMKLYDETTGNIVEYSKTE